MLVDHLDLPINMESFNNWRFRYILMYSKEHMSPSNEASWKVVALNQETRHFLISSQHQEAEKTLLNPEITLIG